MGTSSQASERLQEGDEVESFEDEGEDVETDEMVDAWVGDVLSASSPQTPRFSGAQIMAMVSNFSTSYNVVNISLALPILESIYPADEEDTAGAASSLLAGMALGQLLGGYLGDTRLGRLGALRVVMLLQIVASLASAFLFFGSPYAGLILLRFFLGIGAGGVYPLAAVLSVEQSGGRHQDHFSDDLLSPEERRLQLQSVVLTFSMQGVGFLAVPLVTLPLLHLVPESSHDLVWRLILGAGALPGLVLLLLQRTLFGRQRLLNSGHHIIQQSDPGDGSVQVARSTPSSRSPSVVPQEEPLIDDEDHFYDDPVAADRIWVSIRKEPQLVRKLLGTAAVWALFDVLFYGNTLFQPLVIEAAFGGKSADDELKKAAMDSLLLGCIALPGYVVSALVIGKRLCYVVQQTPRYVQLQGFVAMGLLYAIIGAYWDGLTKMPALLVILYGMTFFFANYGPNTTTFCLPSLVFSQECRSTLNGVCAASGKLGALLGATLFAPAADDLGDDRVMIICSFVSVVAFGLTYLCVPSVSSMTTRRPSERRDSL